MLSDSKRIINTIQTDYLIARSAWYFLVDVLSKLIGGRHCLLLNADLRLVNHGSRIQPGDEIMMTVVIIIWYVGPTGCFGRRCAARRRDNWQVSPVANTSRPFSPCFSGWRWRLAADVIWMLSILMLGRRLNPRPPWPNLPSGPQKAILNSMIIIVNIADNNHERR